MVLCLGSRDSGAVCVERTAMKPCSWGLRKDLLRMWIDECAVNEQPVQ